MARAGEDLEPTAVPLAPRPARRRRAIAFQIALVVACAIFVVLAALAHRSPYFPIDLAVTRGLQSIRTPWFAALMYGLSWLGFYPQIYLLGSGVVLALFFLGLRWEAGGALFAGLGSILVVTIKAIVLRPRPSADLVHVFSELSSPSFPSGHVMQFTAFCGFLLFIVYTLLRPSWFRGVLLAVLGLIVALMGPSRIYLGQHWFSDVMGAYVLGSLWLALTIRVYRWGKSRATREQA